jgi:hypothetical protein
MPRVSAWGRAPKPAPSCAPIAPGVRHDVTDQASMNAVPWNALRPGDVVCVRWNPTAYHSKITFLTRGAPGRPIRVVGLRGPSGERPVIDGADAFTSPLVTPPAGDPKGGIGIVSAIAQYVAPPGSPWGWHPGWISVEGLKIIGGRPTSSYFDGHGKKTPYPDFMGSIYFLGCDHCSILDNEVADSQIGIFVNSLEPTGAKWDRTSVDLVVAGNYIHDNGDATHLGIHNVYVEARGCLFAGNHLVFKKGNVGTNYKSRCGHERIYGNVFSGGWQSEIFVIDPQSGWDTIGAAADYDPTVVAGNVLVAPDGGQPAPFISFGGDTAIDATHYRRKLIAAYNTFVTMGTLGARTAVIGEILLAKVAPAPLPTTWFVGNAVAQMTPSTHLSLATGEGRVLATSNWRTTGVLPRDPYDKSPGVITITSSLPSTPDPGFIDWARGDFRPSPGSPLIDAGVPLSSLPPEAGFASVTDFELYEPAGTMADPWFRLRPTARALDVGAFEAP